MIIERPFRGFRTIALAHHKNYAVSLSAISGIGLTFSVFWVIKAGEYAESLVHLLTAGIVSGFPVGMIIVLLMSLSITAVARALGTYVRIRDAYSIVAYSLVPIILTVLLLLPIEVLTFGLFFFTRNPSPYLLKPLSYIVLIGLDGAFTLWSLMLLLIGITVLLDGKWLKSVTIAFLALCLVVGISVAILRIMFPQV